MDYLYNDEKGPQETIRVTSPYNEDKKIKLGNDNMYVYDMFPNSIRVLVDLNY